MIAMLIVREVFMFWAGTLRVGLKKPRQIEQFEAESHQPLYPLLSRAEQPESANRQRVGQRLRSLIHFPASGVAGPRACRILTVFKLRFEYYNIRFLFWGIGRH